MTDYSSVCHPSVSLIKQRARTKKTLTVSFPDSLLLRLPFSASAAPVIIYFRGCGEETARLKHIGRNVIRSAGPRRICCGRPLGRTTSTYAAGQRRPHCRPPPNGLLPYSSAWDAVPPHRVQYGGDITGGASHEKRAHGAERKQKKVHKKTEKQQKIALASQPPPPPRCLGEPRKVQSVLPPIATTNYTPHPSLSFQKPAKRRILLPQRLLWIWRCLPAPVYGELRVGASEPHDQVRQRPLGRIAGERKNIIPLLNKGSPPTMSWTTVVCLLGADGPSFLFCPI